MTECASLSREIAEAYKRGNKVLICGNGGLAAESEHFAAELMGKYGRNIFIPCIALTSNSSLITAISNDLGFDVVFAHQVMAIGQYHDVFIGMTTSQSSNIWHACHAAENKGLITFIVNQSTVGGTGTAEVQENIIRFLHQVALEAKELCV